MRSNSNASDGAASAARADAQAPAITAANTTFVGTEVIDGSTRFG
jgi:hypothetical protein